MQTGFTTVVRCTSECDLALQRSVDADRSVNLTSFAEDKRVGLTVALLGRLFYRDELEARIGVDTRRLSDAEFVLHAYRHGGFRSLDDLEGEFSLVIWDAERKCLIGMRDPFGAWPLFWFQEGRQFGMGTSLRTVAQYRSSAGINRDFIAEFLMWPNPHDELPIEQTAREGISRVLPGTMVTLFADGRVHRRTCWDWEQRIESGPPTSFEDASENLAYLLREAVRQRCQTGIIGAHLSGGMDSSAVVCLAERLLRDSHPLHTLSLVYDRPSLAGEKEFIDLALSGAPSAKSHLLRGDDVAPFDWFTQPLPAHDEPYAGLPGMIAERLLVAAARAAGVATILTGFGSDEILASNPLTIADALQAGRWWTAFRESRSWGHAVSKGWWSIFRHYGLEPLAPVLFREGISMPWHDEYGDWPRLGWHAIPRWFSQDFAQKYRLRKRGLEHARRSVGKPLTHKMQIAALRTTIGDWARWNLAAPHGIHLSHPFRDPRVVCHALSIPLTLRSKSSQRKPLLQAAMQDILPEGIRNRRSKRGFDDIYGLGLSKNLPGLERLVMDSPLTKSGLIDAKPLLAAMRQAVLGIGDVRACERIDKTLAVLAWAKQMEEAPTPSIEPSRVFSVANSKRF